MGTEADGMPLEAGTVAGALRMCRGSDVVRVGDKRSYAQWCEGRGRKGSLEGWVRDMGGEMEDRQDMKKKTVSGWGSDWELSLLNEYGKAGG